MPFPRIFLNFLSENGVFLSTLEHRFIVNVRATQDPQTSLKYFS